MSCVSAGLPLVSTPPPAARRRRSPSRRRDGQPRCPPPPRPTVFDRRQRVCMGRPLSPLPPGGAGALPRRRGRLGRCQHGPRGGDAGDTAGFGVGARTGCAAPGVAGGARRDGAGRRSVFDVGRVASGGRRCCVEPARVWRTALPWRQVTAPWRTRAMSIGVAAVAHAGTAATRIEVASMPAAERRFALDDTFGEFRHRCGRSWSLAPAWRGSDLAMANRHHLVAARCRLPRAPKDTPATCRPKGCARVFFCCLVVSAGHTTATPRSQRKKKFVHSGHRVGGGGAAAAPPWSQRKVSA